LCRQDHGYQQLIGGIIQQLRLGLGVVGAEIVQYELEAFLSCHCKMIELSAKLRELALPAAKHGQDLGKPKQGRE
jgi:hypothetical protein